MKSVMHYFNDPAVAHPTPVREVRPKPKGSMPSEPVQIRVLVAVDNRGGVAGAQAIDPPANAGEDLISEAVAAARHWKFEPARDHGRNVPGTYTITFRFPPDHP
jgi:TonB family protein